MLYQIDFDDRNLASIKLEAGKNLLLALQARGIDINAVCNGKKTCGKCKVKILAGDCQLTKAEKRYLSKEEIRQGIRLACCQKIKDNLSLAILDKKEFNVLTDTKEEQAEVLKQDKKIIDLNQSIYGLAIDIGTTTIAVYLVDLTTGLEVDNYSLQNPQYKFGADVISRIEFGLKSKDNLSKLQDVLLTKLNQAINKLVQRNEIKNNDIHLTTVVANTVMIYTLLKLDLSGLAKAPYQLLFSSALELTGDRFDLAINPRGIIKIPPLISAYVGADVIANMLATRVDKSSDWVLIVDIGTNGEIVLAKGDSVFACSTAAGPAFEGANISFGQGAVAGAISNYKIENKKIRYKTIADEKATGICGSALIDIIAELYKNSFIDSSGAFIKLEQLKPWQKNRMMQKKQLSYKVLSKEEGASRDIFLTQKDIREFQLAKGAILAGINLLLKQRKVNLKQIKTVYLSGGFGNYINLDNAYLLDLLPEEFKNRIKLLGNGAAKGAKVYLKDENLEIVAKQIKNKAQHLDLAEIDDFQQEFMKSLNFTEEG